MPWAFAASCGSRGTEPTRRAPDRKIQRMPLRTRRKEAICFSPYLYRARNLIERFFNKIKQCRRIATRYDKLAANYLAFIKLASIRIWLRA
jgi:transposase